MDRTDAMYVMLAATMNATFWTMYSAAPSHRRLAPSALTASTYAPDFPWTSTYNIGRNKRRPHAR